jgi:MFS family permease
MSSITPPRKNSLEGTEQWTENCNTRAELASQYVAFEKQLDFHDTVKIYWRSIFWVLYGLIVVFGYGIDGVIAANLISIPRFRQDYGERFGSNENVAYIIPAVWISLFNGTSQISAVIGAYLAGFLAERIGRKNTNLIACILSMGGVAGQYASNGSLVIMIVGKIINGFPIGMWLVLGPLYASEVAPLKLRGWLIAMTNIIQLSGVLLLTGVVYKLGPMEETISYKAPIACQWVVPVIVLLTIPFWPESPVWLVRRARHEDAARSIRRLYGNKGRIDNDGLLAQLQEACIQEQEIRRGGKSSYMECFSKLDRRRTLLCMFIYVCQYLSGLVFVLGYQSYYYQLVGFSAHKSFLLGMLNNTSMFVANILSWFLLSTVGRRPLIVWGQLLGAVFLFVVAGCSIAGTRPGYIATVSFMFIWVCFSFPHLGSLSSDFDD